LQTTTGVEPNVGKPTSTHKPETTKRGGSNGFIGRND
jgi:hypothetical protein